MDCKTVLLEKMDAAAIRYEFPGWDDGEINSLTGAMTVSGIAAGDERYLIFEIIENSLSEGVIQNIALIFGTGETKEWLHVGNGILLDLKDERGKFQIGFGELTLNIRGQSVTVPLDREELIANGYLPAETEALTEDALLFKIVDSIPKELLYSTLDYLKESFALPENARRLFQIESWYHPTAEELDGKEQLKPSSFPDLIEIADAVCSNREPSQLSDKPNTNWRHHK